MTVVVKRVQICAGCSRPNGEVDWDPLTTWNPYSSEYCNTCQAIGRVNPDAPLRRGETNAHPNACTCGSTTFEAHWIEERNAWGYAVDINDYEDDDVIYIGAEPRDTEWSEDRDYAFSCTECGRDYLGEWQVD